MDDSMLNISLNAPYGARCFLTQETLRLSRATVERSYAPYGARCFLTC